MNPGPPPPPLITLGGVPREGSGHPAALAFSPDGRHLAIAYGHDGASVQRVDDGSVVGTLGGPCWQPVFSKNSVVCHGATLDLGTGQTRSEGRALSISPDGKAFVESGSPPVLVDPAGQRHPLQAPVSTPTTRARQSTIEAIVRTQGAPFSPDGRFVVIRGDEGVGIFRVEDGGFVATIARHVPEREPILVGGGVAVARVPSGHAVYELATGRELRVLKPEGPSSIDGAALSADGRLLVLTALRTGIVVDVTTGTVLRTLQFSAGQTARVAALSPDARVLAIAGPGGPPVLYNVDDGQERLVRGRHGGAVMAVDFSGDGTRIVTAAPDGVRVWSADGILLHFAHGVTGGDLAVSRDGREVVVAGTGVARLVEEKGKWRTTGSSELTWRPARVGKDGRTAWVVASNHEHHLIDIATGTRLSTMTVHDDFEVDARGRIATARRGCSSGVRFGTPGAERVLVKADPRDRLGGSGHIALSDDGALLACFGRESSLIDTATGTTTPLEGRDGAFLPGSRRLVVVVGNELRLLDDKGGLQAATTAPAGARVAAVRADGGRVALVRDAAVYLVTLATARQP